MKRLIYILILLLSGIAPAAGEPAKVKIEGLAQVRYRVVGRQVRTSTEIAAVANYSYDEIPVRLSLVLSRSRFIRGQSVEGITAAAAAHTLPARGLVSDIRFAGETRAPRGRYRVMILVMDAADRILTGMNFRGRIRVRRRR